MNKPDIISAFVMFLVGILTILAVVNVMWSWVL